MSRKVSILLGVIACVWLMNSTAVADRHKKKKPVKTISIYDVDSIMCPIPRNRQIFHDRIDKEQRRADVSDGSVDGVINYNDDSLYTRILTKSILKGVDHMEVMIENMPPTR